MELKNTRLYCIKSNGINRERNENKLYDNELIIRILSIRRYFKLSDEGFEEFYENRIMNELKKKTKIEYLSKENGKNPNMKNLWN